MAKKPVYTITGAVLFALTSLAGFVTPANAACIALNDVAIDVNFPDYSFWKPVAAAMQQCGNVSIKFGFDAASTRFDPTNPDQELGSVVGLSNGSLSRLMSQKLLRPLDDLVEKYRSRLEDRQLIKVNGKVVAIAVAGNTKILVAHSEFLKQENLVLPRDYALIETAAPKLKNSVLVKQGVSLAFKAGWNLSQEFFDQFLSQGGILLDEAGKPSLNTPLGLEVLANLKSLSGLLGEAYLEADASQVLDDVLKFRAPIAVLWATSAPPMDNPSVSRVSGKMQLFPAPAVKAGGKPASTLWWDGFAIPVTANDAQADAAFRTALEGLDQEMLADDGDKAIWLVKDFKPGRFSKPVLDAIDAGIMPFPASEAAELLQSALGPKLTAFLEGKLEPAVTLAEAEADYLKAAKERGLAGL